MTDSIPKQRADRTQLQQIIAGLTEGVIIINPDQTIAWANQTALTLHGIKSVAELGATVSEYRERFELRYQNQHRLPEGDYPMERLIAGEAFSKVTAEVARPGRGEHGEDKHWVHQIRSLVLTDHRSQPDCLVLIINDETERFNAEQRFERAFGANPAPAIIVRLGDYLLSAETVTIHHERCVLSAMQDITQRKQTETELVAAIESVMQDASWFGQRIVEKLASLTQAGGTVPDG